MLENNKATAEISESLLAIFSLLAACSVFS